MTMLRHCLVAVVLTLVSGVAAIPAQAQSSIYETFAGGLLPSELEPTGGVGQTCCGGQFGGPVFENGSVRFGGDDTQGDGSGFLRTYLRTIQSDYSAVDFAAYVTVTVPNKGSVARNIVFFGFGSGGIDQSPGSGVPSFDGMLLQVDPDSFFPGIQGLDGATPSAIWNSNTLTCGGYGTFRLRIQWTAATQRAVLSVHPNYVGGPFAPNYAGDPFVPNCQFPPFDGSDNGFTAFNSSIFFGGDWDAVFDNFVVVSGQVRGFFAPVWPGQPTIAKAGAILPLKWEIFDGLAPGGSGPSVPGVMPNEISNPAIVSSLSYTNTPVPCSTSPQPPSSGPVSLLGRGRPLIWYDFRRGVFEYDWLLPQTPGCYTVTMTTPTSTMSTTVNLVAGHGHYYAGQGQH
jgi:hypothetical protein